MGISGQVCCALNETLSFVQDMLEMSTEQRLNFVAVNKTFQARRKVLLDQRQSIYGLLQRPKTRYNNAEDIIVEFLKVPVAPYVSDDL